jgi:hypothetical protein
MTTLRVIYPYIAIYFAVLAAGLGFVKFIVYANVLALIAIIAAPGISAYIFIKQKNRLFTKNEALILTGINGTPVFLMFAFINSPELSEPYTGWLLRLVTLMFGAFLGYGCCAIYYFGKGMWSKHLKV